MSGRSTTGEETREARIWEPRDESDPRSVPTEIVVPCCKVRQTLQVGPEEEIPPGDGRWGVLWESVTPLEQGQADCDDGLLSLNFVSFQTSSGDYITTTRAIELFLVRSNSPSDARADVWAIPLFVGTVASFFAQYEGGMPVPLDPGGPARMWLRVRVASGASQPWSVLAGVMQTAQNSF